MYPEIAPPDWDSLPGGDDDTSAWITFRDRKLAKAAQVAGVIGELGRRLAERGALYLSTPDVLRAEPDAAQWYLDLAGMVPKLITMLEDAWKAFDLGIRPDTLASNLGAGRRVSDKNVAAFSRWINAELDRLYPIDSRTLELATATILVVVGARVHGQVQNMAGDDAVLRLKLFLVAAMQKRGHISEVGIDRDWALYDPALDLTRLTHIRFGGRLVCEFTPGGNRPDIKVLRDGVVVLNGEVKGRADLSNLWESWMPQINGHLQTWVSENAAAPRVFFGTIVTQEMIDGLTRGGTLHTGLRAFHRNGLLTSAHNLTNIATDQPGSVRAFDQFVDALSMLVRPHNAGLTG